MTTQKSERLEARLTPEEARLIQRAVELAGGSKTDFTVAATVARAREVLADQRVFLVDDAAWTELNAILDAPAQHRPRLAKLMAEPSVFEQ